MYNKQYSNKVTIVHYTAYRESLIKTGEGGGVTGLQGTSRYLWFPGPVFVHLQNVITYPPHKHIVLTL